MPHISIYPRRRIEVPSLRDGDVDVAQSAHNQKPVGALFRAPAESKAPSAMRPPSSRPRQSIRRAHARVSPVADATTRPLNRTHRSEAEVKTEAEAKACADSRSPPKSVAARPHFTEDMLTAGEFCITPLLNRIFW